MIGPPAAGRCHQATRRVRLGDAGLDGRLRLDALACYLQDIASDDVADAGLPRDDTWVVRRTTVEVHRRPSLAEEVALRTWCSGTGHSWAERRTSLETGRGAGIESAALWVLVDPVTGAPRRLPEAFGARFGSAADGRRVTARRRHPDPPVRVTRRAWPLRRADFDVLGHANNAAYWAAVEEVAEGRAAQVAEIEYRAGIDPGDQVELLVASGTDTDGTDGTDGSEGRAAERLSVWFVVDTRVRASARLWVPPES